MFSFIKAVSDILVTLISMIINIVSMLIEIILIIPNAIAYAVYAVGWLPAFCGSVVLVGVGLSTALFIINHGSD